MKRAIRIGITGKLGSGKSTLAAMMDVRGIPVIRSDELARELMEHDASLRTELEKLLGPEAYKNGILDRAFVASRIFHDHALKENVEAAVHPVVTRAIEQEFERHPGEPVAVESALILQSKFRERFDYIVLIDAPDEVAISRVTKEGRITKADAEARLAEQRYDRVPREEADFIIENNGSAEAFREKCDRLIAMLEMLFERALPDEPLHLK